MTALKMPCAYAGEIEPSVMPDVSGMLWYLDEINNSKLLYLSGIIKAAEFAFNIGRVSFPTLGDCPAREAQMSRPHAAGETEHWRLVRDLWMDGIDVAAKHLLSSYKQLPFALSAEDAIYYDDGKGGMRGDYMWTAAVYGGDVKMLLATAERVGVAINIRHEISPRVKVRGQTNELYAPNVVIMDVTLIDGGMMKLPTAQIQ